MTSQTFGVLGLTLAYIALAVLLLSLNVRSRWHWMIKGAAVALTSAFYVCTYLAIQGLLGWPIKAAPPHNVELVAVHVQEPDKRSGKEGWIYLWLKPQESRQAPRAYAFPYTPAFYAAVLGASKKLDRGIRQLGVHQEEDSGADIAEVTDSSRLGQESIPIVFYDPPDPLYPAEK